MINAPDILKFVMDEMDEGIALVDALGSISHANHVFYKLLHLDDLSLSHTSLQHLFPEIDVDLSTDKKIPWQYSLIKSIELSLTPIPVKTSPHGFLLRVRRPLSKSYAPVSSFWEIAPATVALDAVKEGIIILNHDGRVLFYNKVQLNFDGLALEEVTGRYPWEIYGMRTDMSTLWQVLSTGEPVKGFVQYYCRKNGQYARVNGDSYPIRIHGRIVGAVAVYGELSDTGNETIKIISVNGSPLTISESHHETANNGIKRKKQHPLNEGQSTSPSKLFTFTDILGESPSLQKCIIQAEKAATNTSPVMLFGETGTGKEMFAQSIHCAGHRKDKPFMALNCAAVPENLIEGILFGTRKGVYTGAFERKGLFQEANGGTFFLDELNSMPVSVQGKLLRVLEEGRVRPLGSKDEIPVDVRIISCCNKNYEKLLNEGILRSDLFYRLAVLTIQIPPLRERKSDIHSLVMYFIHRFNVVLKKKVERVSPFFMQTLLAYPWPGNVRQLKHCIESAMIMTPNNSHQLGDEDLPEYLKHDEAHCHFEFPHVIEQGYFEPFNAPYPDNADKSSSQSSHPPNENPLANTKKALPTGKALDAAIFENEKQTIVSALIQAKGNVSKAAELLKISRGSLYYRMKKFEVR